MKRSTRYLLPSAIMPLVLIGSAHAAVIAFTDFNSRTVVANTASNLNWVLNGINDPGSMSASVGANPQNLFDNAGTVSKTLFAPSLNYGNAGGSWVTNFAITLVRATM